MLVGIVFLIMIGLDWFIMALMGMYMGMDVEMTTYVDTKIMEVSTLSKKYTEESCCNYQQACCTYDMFIPNNHIKG